MSPCETRLYERTVNNVLLYLETVTAEVNSHSNCAQLTKTIEYLQRLHTANMEILNA